MSLSIQTSYSTAPATAYAGLLASAHYESDSLKNVEASASMPFGIAVAFKTAAPATNQDVLLPAAQADKIAGIVILSQEYARTHTLAGGGTAGDLDATGLVPGTMMNVMRKGRIWVTVATGCAVGDRLYIRRAAGTLGSAENAADGTNMVDCTKQGVFVTSCTAGGLAIVEVDFVNLP